MAADVPALEHLIAESVRGLSVGYYSTPQIESALRHVFGPDTALIADGTYYVVEGADHGLVACGGWSRRRTLFGGDQAKDANDDLLDPAIESARIRAFFVHPGAARQGLGRRLFAECQTAARAAGFHTMELAATMPGEPLYAALGFTVIERLSASFPDGMDIALTRMTRRID